MTRFVKGWLGVAATTATLALGGGQAFAQDIVFGLQCDRTALGKPCQNNTRCGDATGDFPVEERSHPVL